jgi:hypothetical protein
MGKKMSKKIMCRENNLTSGGGIEVGLSPHHSNVKGLNPDTSSTKNGKENVEKRMCCENKVLQKN